MRKTIKQKIVDTTVLETRCLWSRIWKTPLKVKSGTRIFGSWQKTPKNNRRKNEHRHFIDFKGVLSFPKLSFILFHNQGELSLGKNENLGKPEMTEKLETRLILRKTMFLSFAVFDSLNKLEINNTFSRPIFRLIFIFDVHTT